MARREKRAHSVRGRIIGIVLLCWFLPLALMLVLLLEYGVSKQVNAATESYVEQVVFHDQICKERLNHAVTASYDRTILAIEKEYREGKRTFDSAYWAYQEYLQENYQRDAVVSDAILWFYGEDKGQRCAVYNLKAGGGYAQISQYWTLHHETIKEAAEKAGTEIRFLYLDGALYLVRNLVNSAYEPVGALVLRLNKTYCVEGLNLLSMTEKIVMDIDGLVIPVKGEKIGTSYEDLERTGRQGYVREKGRTYVYHELTGTSYRIRTLAELDDNILRMAYNGYRYILFGMIVALIVLLTLLFREFSRDIMKPVKAMIDGAKRIEEGELGHQIKGAAPNREFQYLTDSFNRMSCNLKKQFDQIYREEIALREARIMAFQSNINPHFLNNTLEIINWEARLAGDLKVTEMIGALSVLLDAALDRKGRPEVRLGEEMRYVNSYLYITKERLGKRLTVDIDVPEELLGCEVPRLILQPVMENAIEHGVVQCGKGRVSLRAYRDENYLYLETENSGTLSDEGKERIERLLRADYNAKNESSGSIGIANVNQRLRIIYGEPCGLQIWQKEEGIVAARLTILLAKQDR